MVPLRRQRLEPCCILVIEDDHDVRVSVRNAFEDVGYRVLSVTDGKHALELLESTGERPDLILLDLLLPVMDGWEFAARLRSMQRTPPIPIAVMSAFDRTPPPGTVAFLKKPITREALLRLASTYCAH